MFLLKFKDFNGNEVQQLFISFFGWCFNFEFYSCICGRLHPSEIFSYKISESVVIFEYSLTYSIFFSKTYNMMSRVVWLSFFWGRYDYKAKTFCRGFSAIENLYIKFYRSDLRKHFGVGKHVGVLSYIQLFSVNMGGICMECVYLVST